MKTKVVWQSSVALFSFALILKALFALAHFNLEQHAVFLWLGVGLSCIFVGYRAARQCQRIPSAELACAIACVVIVAGAWTVFSEANLSINSSSLRALFVSPFAMGLFTYFGASLGFLLWGDGSFEKHLSYESFVARRFLLAKGSNVLSTVTTISVFGVALGVWLVTVSMGILSGFEHDLEQKIIGANAHVLLKNNGPFAFNPETLARIQQTKHVVAASPYIDSEVAIVSSSNYTAALIFGIDSQLSRKVLQRLPAIADDSSIVLGSEMAHALNVEVGEKVRLISPQHEVLTPLGPMPRTVTFTVSGIFTSKMYEYDARYAYLSLNAARRFLDLDSEAILGFHVLTDDAEFSERVGETLTQNVGLISSDWKARNQTLLASLKLERVVAFVVLIFIIWVASFSIVNTLSMNIIEKSREIAILKTMGASNVGIMKLFLMQGLIVGGLGVGIGSLLALITIVFLKHFGFWIPSDVYYIEALPVYLGLSDFLLIIAAALLIVWNFAVYPALRGAQRTPVEGLRDG